MARFENNLEVADFVPWHDSRDWKKGRYYPLPHSSSSVFGNVTLKLFGIKKESGDGK